MTIGSEYHTGRHPESVRSSNESKLSVPYAMTERAFMIAKTLGTNMGSDGVV